MMDTATMSETLAKGGGSRRDRDRRPRRETEAGDSDKCLGLFGTTVGRDRDGETATAFTFSIAQSVDEVQEGGRAAAAGIRLGDVLLRINGMETEGITLEKAREIIEDAGDTIDLAVSKLEDQEVEEVEMTPEEQRAAALALMAEEEERERQERVDVNLLDLPPPRPAPCPELAKRKCWHPIVLDTAPPPIIEVKTGDEEAPHKRLMRNLRQAMDAKKIQKPSPEGKAPPRRKPPPPPSEEEEDPNAEPSIADQLRMMQKQLAALSSLPAVLQQSLSMVSQNLTRMMPPEPETEYETETEELESDVEYTEEEYTNEYVTEDEVSAREVPTPDPSSEMVEEVEEEEVEEEPEPEPEPEPTQEELDKLDKLRKLKELNRAWPWGDAIKPVYKISDRYKVPHSDVFSSKLQSMENRKFLRNGSGIISTEETAE